jgi:hypothetical protein
LTPRHTFPSPKKQAVSPGPIFRKLGKYQRLVELISIAGRGMLLAIPLTQAAMEAVSQRIKRLRQGDDISCLLN